MRIISKVIAAILMASIAFLAVSPLAAAFVTGGNSNIVFGVVFLAVLAACLLAPTGRRAWGRGALLCGFLFLALPISVLVLSGTVSNELIKSSSDTSGAEAAGAIIGSGLMVGASAFFGFIIGGIFVITGLVLVLGGTRDVRIVEK